MCGPSAAQADRWEWSYTTACGARRAASRRRPRSLVAAAMLPRTRRSGWQGNCATRTRSCYERELADDAASLIRGTPPPAYRRGRLDALDEVQKCVKLARLCRRRHGASSNYGGSSARRVCGSRDLCSQAPPACATAKGAASSETPTKQSAPLRDASCKSAAANRAIDLLKSRSAQSRRTRNSSKGGGRRQSTRR